MGLDMKDLPSRIEIMQGCLSDVAVAPKANSDVSPDLASRTTSVVSDRSSMVTKLEMEVCSPKDALGGVLSSVCLLGKLMRRPREKEECGD